MLHDPLVAWHLLSLDAPSVAVAWTGLFAHAAHVPLPWTTLAAMFLAVWIVYAADRLLDAASAAGRLEQRHLFHKRHQRVLLSCLCIAAAVLLPLIGALPQAQLHADAVLGCGLLLWFVLVHCFPELRLPKELSVGVFFGCAVSVPALASPALLSAGVLWPAALLFAILCALNCLWISLWESASGSAPASRSLLRGVTVALVLTPLITPRSALPASLAFALALAAAGLLLLDCSPHLARTRLRAAADLVLLTPLLVLPFLR